MGEGLIRVGFPLVVQAGHNYFLQERVEDVVKDLRKNGFSGVVDVRGFVTSAVGKVYHGRKIRLDIDRGEMVFRKDKRIWKLISGTVKE